jgi:putative oxidoreductase
VQLFAAIGIGQWFRYFTGLLEIASAVGLFVATLAPFAAMLSAAVMTGAVLTHLFIVGGSPVAALLVLVASLTIAWLRRVQVSPLRTRRIAA